MTKKVLFLCTGNSCRSQMAEAVVNARLAGRWQAYSAGVKPSGFVHPMTLQVLREIGIEHRGESKSSDRFRDMDLDLVVTVCDDAAENCPVWLGQGRRAHLGFKDPSEVQGTEEARLAAFRSVRDEILQKVPELLGSRFD
jgi:arsenate reductase (thioredoxin)